MSEAKSKLPKGWQWVRLGDVCHEDRQTVLPQTLNSRELPYLGLEHIESETGQILRKPSEHVVGEVLSNTFYFDDSHVLYGKLRPYLNKVAVPNFAGRCSTEIIPLLPGEEVERSFLALLLRRPATVSAVMNGTTGSRMPRADMGLLMSVLCPLPPLDEQRRIVALLDHKLSAVARARAAAQAQLAAAQALPAAYLRGVFESDEAKGWERKQLSDICNIEARQVDPTIPEYGNLPHVSGENIESGTGRLIHIRTAAEDGMTSGKYLFDAGDVLYSKLRPYLRKVAFAEFRGVCSADMYPIKTDQTQLEPRFLVWLLLSKEFTSYANEESQRSRMPKLNREQLFAWSGGIPSPDRQIQIADHLETHLNDLQRLETSITAQLATIDALPAALLRQAFNGEL